MIGNGPMVLGMVLNSVSISKGLIGDVPRMILYGAYSLFMNKIIFYLKV